MANLSRRIVTRLFRNALEIAPFARHAPAAYAAPPLVGFLAPGKGIVYRIPARPESA
jgi:hypothetical protein